MGVSLPDGSVFAIASTYGAVKQMTALSNANPGVATLEASHGVVTGDIMEVTSGWEDLTGMIIKAGTVATNDVPLSGIDTTDTTRYPASAGIGSVREITAWVPIPQITGFSGQGGDQQFATYSPLESRRERQLPTVLSAQSLALTIADDPTLACYAILKAAARDKVPRAVRLSLPNGGVIYYNGYVGFNDQPTLTKGSVITVAASLSFSADPNRY